MFSFIRKRLTYANAAVTAALVFAMAGGAFAASGGAGSSPAKAGSGSHSSAVASTAKKKGKSKSKSTRGPAGPAGKEGKQGPAGPEGKAGATGPEGKAGATGPAGSKGETGATGPEGKEGKAGANGTTGFTETLPAGRTETGIWVAKPKEGEVADVPISFNIPLPEALGETHIFVVTKAEWAEEEVEEPVGSHTMVKQKDPSACEGGTPEDPKAGEGYFCLYEGFMDNAEINVFSTPYGFFEKGIGTAGTIMAVEATGEPLLAYGTWAVTAE